MDLLFGLQKKGFSLFVMVAPLLMSAQKEVVKSVLDPGVRSVHIDATNCFQVVLQTYDTPHSEIVLEGKMDGEYSPDLQMTAITKGNTMFVNAGFSALFKHPNDKLSAHKVVSIALKVLVPAGLQVLVTGTSARVMASGSYEELGVILSDGNCVLTGVTRNARVNTQSGNIALFTANGNVNASSKYGKVSRNPVPKGHALFNLSTVTGYIELNKTE